jgi:phenol 2-monooxygenase
MMIPRERKLVRIYVELSPEAADRYRVGGHADVLMEQVATIMQPYTIRTSHIEWSTIYTVSLSLNLPFPRYFWTQKLTTSRLASAFAEISVYTIAYFLPETPSTRIPLRLDKG